ncbi:MAG TPA: presqualene diphosphate synthase HpnD [Caulobacteraceae bacterium]|jgi:phytoene synthase|nr:presqualene diphosphate synthase HpnD [Caulobacteraceae bacterium]
MTSGAAAKNTSQPKEAAGGASAQGSSFYSAMRVLPKRERAAMFAIYAFCRQVDDIADEKGLTPEERRAHLNVWRRAVDSLYTASPSSKVRELHEPTKRYKLDRDDFLDVIDGMEMDVGEPIRRPPYKDLDLYCDRVASAVGRLSVKVFGMDDEPGRELAHHLGRALQLTNILRDLDEDAAMGRLYVPEEALALAGIPAFHHPVEVLSREKFDVAARWLAALAHQHYAAAAQVLAKRPKGRLRAPRLMGAVYQAILKRMETAGWSEPRQRVSLGKAQLAWIMATRGLGR